MKKREKHFYLAIILAIILIANSIYMPQVAASEGSHTVSENNFTVSENELTVSENGITVSENDLTVSENDLTVSENGITISGNGITVSENELTVSENGVTVSENDLAVSENDLTVSENDITISGNGITVSENELMVSENDVAVFENSITVSENSITVSTNEIADSADEYIEEDRTDAENNGDILLDEDGNVVDVTDKIWIAGFERESEKLTYTGGKILQNIRVYHEGKLLKEKTDYTLTYSNNVKAATFDSSKAPAVKVTMTGQYAGSRTLYYTIGPRKLDEIDTVGYEQIVTYKKSISIPQPKLFMGNKQLVSGKDFVCDYSSLPEQYKKGDSYNAGEIYEYAVNGTGNFTGSLTMRLVVIKDKQLNFANASVKLDENTYEYCGDPLLKDDVRIVYLKAGKVMLDKALYDYTVHADTAGIGYVEVFPTKEGLDAGYRGKKRVSFKVVGDRSIKFAQLGEMWKDSVVFSAEELEEKRGFLQEKEGVLIYPAQDGMDELLEGRDYSVTYSNHKKAGEAVVVFKGMGRYTGKIKKTYKILSNKELKLQWLNMDGEGQPVEVYTKGGVTPHFCLTERNDVEGKRPLVEKKDYTVKLSDNKKIGIMKCEIIGKGNYKGYRSITYVEIVSADIGRGLLTVSDRQYSTKKNAWKSSVKITDVNGKTLKAGTDYDREVIYEYEGMEGGIAPQAGTVIYVTVHGINNYEGTVISAKYRIYSVNINSLVVVVDPQEYTGRAIELTKDDIHVYAGKKDLKQGNEIGTLCYEIIKYSNNTRVGTAKVTIRGIGDYGATKTCSFKIAKKNFLTERVMSVLLDASAGTLGTGNSIQLTATVTPENAMNKTIIWSTTNSKVATVSKDGLVTAKKAGKATIRAVSQDSGKKAEYKVTVEFIPVTSIILSAEEIVQDVGTDYRLEVVSVMPENASPELIYWESSNPDAVTVNDEGIISFVQSGMAVISAYTEGKNAVGKCLATANYSEQIPEGNYLTPQEYRTVEQEDDTEAINTAISMARKSGKHVYIPSGIYRINAEHGVRPQGGVDFIMAKDAVLQAINNSSKNYNVIKVRDAKNITISGGQIKGERYGHGDTRGEWGMGIGIYDSKYITVSDVSVSDCWGDGIYLGSQREFEENPGCSGITITNCDLFNNRRNNLSIVCADNVTVEGCSFRNANGTAPQFGIDIETNNLNNPCEHITISNSEFVGNEEAAMGIMTNANDVIISGCTMDGMFVNRAGKNVRFENSVIHGEMNSVIGVSLGEGVVFNDGTDTEDVLVASFKAGESDFSYVSHQLDSENKMSVELVDDEMSSTGKTLHLKRLTKGTHEAGYYLTIEDMTGGKMKALKADTNYRFEYVVRGEGQWGIKTNQTGWYPIIPIQNTYGTCYTTYGAKDKDAGKVMLFAIENVKDMYLMIESVNIYEVK